MTCIVIGHGKERTIVCVSPWYRLPLADGTRIYMEWHRYCGPTFFKNKNCTKEVVEWYENPLICEALDWFCKRGHRA